MNISKITFVLTLLAMTGCGTQHVYEQDASYSNSSRSHQNSVDLIGATPSCAGLVNDALIVMRLRRGYDVIYAYDPQITNQCCLSRSPTGATSANAILRKVCIAHGETGWSLASSPNHIMQPMKIHLPGWPTKQAAYNAALKIVVQ